MFKRIVKWYRIKKFEKAIKKPRKFIY